MNEHFLLNISAKIVFFLLFALFETYFFGI